MHGIKALAAAHPAALLASCLLLTGCYGAFEYDSGETTVVVISRPPQSTAVTVGQPARFEVAASGSGAFNYQWQRNGQAIAGATGADYVTPPATSADDGTLFTVTVCDISSCATSLPALLTVLRSQ
jgi:beta-galactosidase